MLVMDDTDNTTFPTIWHITFMGVATLPRWTIRPTTYDLRPTTTHSLRPTYHMRFMTYLPHTVYDLPQHTSLQWTTRPIILNHGESISILLIFSHVLFLFYFYTWYIYVFLHVIFTYFIYVFFTCFIYVLFIHVLFTFFYMFYILFFYTYFFTFFLQVSLFIFLHV